MLYEVITHAFKKTNIFLNKFMQVLLTITDSSLTVSAHSGEVGTTTESVKSTTEGEELTLSFNQRYLQEPLQYVVDDSLVMHFAGIGRPIRITSYNVCYTKLLRTHCFGSVDLYFIFWHTHF